jgi:uncharacterized cupredoxin-like copper-binding protein
MKRFPLFGGILVIVSFILLQGVSQATAAKNRTYQMTGKITAIDMAYQTVVIEVPMGKDSLTVGGPLSPRAVLKKGGKAVQLPAFKVGEKVTVAWRSTAEGHVIERLEAM